MAKQSLPEQLLILPYLARWIFFAALIGMLAGSASAFFLWALDGVTATRVAHAWLLFLLPLAGLVVVLVYRWVGSSVEAGNNLIIDAIHDPSKTVPLRMAPLILGGTLITHLFGGSAGREGTAVQMATAFADQLAQWLRLDTSDRRLLLMAGISAGFASVFGTPLAGAIFGLEVLAIGRLRYDAILPCFIAAIVGDQTTLLCGIHHVVYVAGALPKISPFTVASAVIAGIAFGVVGMLFAESTHALNRLFKHYLPAAPLRPFVGGSIVVIAALSLHTTKYLGLGIPTMIDAFVTPLPAYDWLGKMIFTVVTLAAGFKGGEVTPLFFIGATLGNALAYVLPLPFPLLAGLGFVAVFAGAANTPIASTIMAIELFGSEIGVYAALACVVSYLFSGHTGIYQAQRIGQSKHVMLPENLRLSEVGAFRKIRKTDGEESNSTQRNDEN